jgi:hypothetical protein
MRFALHAERSTATRSKAARSSGTLAAGAQTRDDVLMARDAAHDFGLAAEHVVDPVAQLALVEDRLARLEVLLRGARQRTEGTPENPRRVGPRLFEFPPPTVTFNVRRPAERQRRMLRNAWGRHEILLARRFHCRGFRLDELGELSCR